jgi:hypothetical protein
MLQLTLPVTLGAVNVVLAAVAAAKLPPVTALPDWS